NASDIEVALVIHDLMRALGVEDFEVRVNNRLVLNGLLEQLGLEGRAAALLIALDKLPKIGSEAVTAEMVEKAGVLPEQARRVLALAQVSGSNAEVLDRLQRDFGGNAKAADGIARLGELVAVAKAAGVPEERIKLDLSIARGLDYYTGTIYETFLLGSYRDEKGQEKPLAGFGSVCSGGRYDNLAGLYTKQQLPGVGASLGLDRLLAVLEVMDVLAKAAAAGAVVVVQFEAARLGDYQRIARVLRGQGIGVEVYPEAKKVGTQIQYADRRGFRVALIAGENEFARGEWKVKDLQKREEVAVPEARVADAVRSALASV